MRKVALRGLLAHKARVLMTVVAVALGVAFMAGVLVFTDTMNKSFDDLMETAYDGTDAVVRSEETMSGPGFGMPDPRGTLDEGVLEQVRGVDSVNAAAGEVEGMGQLIDVDGEPMQTGFGGPSIVVSTDPEVEEAWEDITTIELNEGGWPTSDNEIVFDAATLTRSGYQLGDTAQLQTDTGVHEYTVAGTISFGGSDSAAGQSLLVLSTPEAQRVIGEPGRLDTISVRANDDVSQEQVTADIEEVVAGSGVEVLTGEAATEEAQDELQEALSFVTVFLLVFAVVALVVGAFVIFNSFAIIVAQRTREMALLRAIGASRRQVRRSVLVESVVTGLVGSAVGLLVGLGLATMLSTVIDVDGGLALLPASLITALVIGVAVTVFSSLVPAWRASRVAPVAAMRDVAIDTSGRSLVRLAIGALLVGLGGVLGVSGAGTEEPGLVGMGVALAFLGVLFLAPGLARPVSRVLGAPLARFRGVTGGLARNNASRNPRRTASTGLALTIGVGIVAFFLVLNASVRSSLDQVIDESFTGDFTVEGAAMGMLGLPTELAPSVEELDSVDQVTAVRFTDAEVDGSSEMLAASSASVFEQFGFETSGDAGLGEGEVVMREAAADSAGLSLGDTVQLKFLDQDEQASLTLAGLYEEKPGLVLGDYIIGLDEVDRHVSGMSDNMVVIDLVDGAEPDEAREEINHVVAGLSPSAEVQDNEDMKQSIASELDEALMLIMALLVLAIFIATIGIANTIALSTLERTRELGLLRAVGMTRPQLRAAVRWESVIIALFGTGLGMAVGVLGGWGLITSLSGDGLEVFSLPIFQIVVLIVLAGALGIGAALWPAWRAGRLNVLDAIHTD